MSKYDHWTLGLIDSAWFGSDYEGKGGREEAKRIGFESLDLFVGFDPGRMSKTNRERYVTENQSAGLPIVSLVCTCLGLSDFNPAIRDYHIERAKNVVDLAAEFASARNLCFVPGEYMFQKKLIPAKSEWDLVVDATRQVGKHAAEKRFELAIELLPFEFAFINSLDTMERFLDEIGLVNVKATVDISHFWLMRIPPADSGTVSPTYMCPIATASITVTCRQGVGIRRSRNIWRRSVTRVFIGAASIELEFPPDPRGMVAWVEEAHGAALQLLKDAGVHTA